MATPSDKDVTEIARQLARAGASTNSKVYSMSFWNERLLEWALARPEFKAQLFRFVDVFPATTNDKDVLRHVQEYLSDDDVPAALRAAIAVAGRVPLGAKVTASQARSNVERMAKQFILGTTTEEAVLGARNLWESGAGSVVDLLGEKTVSDSEAANYAARIHEVLDGLTASAPTWKANPTLDKDDRDELERVSISIKPTALASKYKPLTREAGLEQAKQHLRSILTKAKANKAFVWFDMEHYEVKDLSIELFKQLLSEGEFKDLRAGIVMQAYLRDTYEDLANLISWSDKRGVPVSVRLVKGAYWDTETIIARANDWPVPVFENKVESDANYERCARLMLDHPDAIRSAFASHNLRSLAFAIAYARKNKLPDNAFEIQMLYGMAEPMHEAIKKAGLRLRVYAPVGEVVPGMAYLVRRLLENTSNESFVKLRFADNKGLDELLNAPRVDTLPDRTMSAERTPTDVQDVSPYRPEPPAEWFRETVRTSMSDQISKLSTSSTAYVHAVIDGKQRKTQDSIESVNPSSPSQIVARSASCSVEDVDEAVSSALRAFPKWRDTPAIQRAKILFGAADWLRKRRFEVCALQVHEAGKPWADADGDVCEAIDFCEFYGREAIRLESGGAVQSPPGEANALRYRGRGVAGVIAPWNFPLAIPLGMTVAAIAAGNTVVLKPSEQAPAIGNLIVRALRDAGLPDGVLQFVPGRGEVVGSRIVEHRDVSTIAFTGSREVGLGIIEQAAKHTEGCRVIKKVIAELGGKNPMIVDTDADLDQAVPAIIHSAFGYTGQKCSALSRLIVRREISDVLHERIIGALKDMKIGAPVNMGVDVGPVIEQDAQRRIQDVVESAPTWGEVIASRTDLPNEGYFVPPTVVRNVKPDSPLARDEIFGPVLSTFEVSDLDEAIPLANDSEYALTAGLFSRSPSNIARASSEIRAGNLYINRQMTGAVVGRQPFGGNALSGGGTKAGGPDYLLNFMEPVVITENTIRQGFADLT